MGGLYSTIFYSHFSERGSFNSNIPLNPLSLDKRTHHPTMPPLPPSIYRHELEGARQAAAIAESRKISELDARCRELSEVLFQKQVRR